MLQFHGNLLRHVYTTVCGERTNLGFGWMVGIDAEANERSGGPTGGKENKNKWCPHVPKYRKFGGFASN